MHDACDETDESHRWMQWRQANWEGRYWLSANMAAQDELSKFLPAFLAITIYQNILFVAVKHVVNYRAI